MLFKINDFLRNIDNKLGSPINNFQITVKNLFLFSMMKCVDKFIMENYIK